MKAPGQNMATQQAMKAASPFFSFGILQSRFAGLRKKRVARYDQDVYSYA
jgi:hypothetical protein